MILLRHNSAYLIPSKKAGQQLLRISDTPKASKDDAVLVQQDDGWKPLGELNSNLESSDTNGLGAWRDKNQDGVPDGDEVESLAEHFQVKNHEFLGAEVLVGKRDKLIHTVHAPSDKDTKDVAVAAQGPEVWLADGNTINLNASAHSIPASEQADAIVVNRVYGKLPKRVPKVTRDVGQAWKLVDHLRTQEFRSEHRYPTSSGEEKSLVREGSFTDIRVNNSKKKTKVNLTTGAGSYSMTEEPEGVARAVALAASSAATHIQR